MVKTIEGAKGVDGRAKQDCYHGEGHGKKLKVKGS